MVMKRRLLPFHPISNIRSREVNNYSLVFTNVIPTFKNKQFLHKYYLSLFLNRPYPDSSPTGRQGSLIAQAAFFRVLNRTETTKLAKSFLRSSTGNRRTEMLGVRISVRFGQKKRTEPRSWLGQRKYSTGNRTAEQRLAADSMFLYE